MTIHMSYFQQKKDNSDFPQKKFLMVHPIDKTLIEIQKIDP